MADDGAASVPAQFPQPAALSGADAIRRAVEDALHPSQFLVGKRIALEWAAPLPEEVAWEVFRGRLLDASQTRQRHAFESWNIFQVGAEGRSPEPILSIKWDTQAGQLHVMRAIYCYAWEAFDAADQVIHSRETRKWVRELVGTVDLGVVADAEQVRRQLSRLVFQAVVGTSRLPLTSLEAPLPAFTLGDLAYFQRRKGDTHLFPSLSGVGERSESEQDGKRCVSPFLRALTVELSWQEKAKLLEALLRFTPASELPAAVELFVAGWKRLGLAPAEIPVLLRTVFNEVALSPYTDFVDKTLDLLRLLENGGHLTADAHADFLSFLLRHLARHLTAYDLVTFHHRGANYPDALLLDAALRAYLFLAGQHPSLFADSTADGVEAAQRKRIRRRALRMGFLLRRQYEGHAVPDVPTSPGENMRVLPAPFERLPEEQILDPTRRSRRLFAAEPLTLTEASETLLRQSIEDLDHAAELQELGTALFLDRPLGISKRPAEPDRTPLLSYVAFSPSIAERRLRFITEVLKFIGEAALNAHCQRLRSDLSGIGLPIQPSGQPARPGVVSLDDALRVAGDFVVLRTTRQTAHDFCEIYGLRTVFEHLACRDLQGDRCPLIIGGASVPGLRAGTLAIFDDRFRLRLELEIDVSCTSTADGEYPGLIVRRVWTGEKEGLPPTTPIRLTAPCPATRQ